MSKNIDLSKIFRKIKILVKIVQSLYLSKSLKSLGKSQLRKSLNFFKISKELFILIKRIYSNQKNPILFTILKQISILIKTSKDLDLSHHFQNN